MNTNYIKIENSIYFYTQNIDLTQRKKCSKKINFIIHNHIKNNDLESIKEFKIYKNSVCYFKDRRWYKEELNESEKQIVRTILQTSKPIILTQDELGEIIAEKIRQTPLPLSSPNPEIIWSKFLRNLLSSLGKGHPFLEDPRLQNPQALMNYCKKMGLMGEMGIARKKNIKKCSERAFSPKKIPPQKIQRKQIKQENRKESVKNINEEIKTFYQQVETLENQYKKWKKSLQGCEGAHNQFFKGVEYLNLNKTNFLSLINYLLNLENGVPEKWANEATDYYKNTKSIGPLISSLLKWYIASEAKKELKEHIRHFERLKTKETSLPESPSSQKLQEIQKKLISLNRQLQKDKAGALKKGEVSLRQLTTRFSPLLLTKVFNLSAKIASKLSKNTLKIFKNIRELVKTAHLRKTQKEWIHHLQPPLHPDFLNQKIISEKEQFFSSLESCRSLEEVKRKFKELGINYELPLTFHLFQQGLAKPRFRRSLLNAYYFSKGQHILLREMGANELKTQRLENKISCLLPSIREHIEQCREMTKEQIQAYFVQTLQIELKEEDFTLPIEENIGFQRLIARKRIDWIDSQETTARLTEQAIRQALLSKHRIEKKFLFFRAGEYLFGIASAAIQLGLCTASTPLGTVGSALELLGKNLMKLGLPNLGILYLGSPLYPRLTFKVQNLLMQAVEHCFGARYKPQEYSLEGYKTAFQIRLLELNFTGYYLAFLLKQAALYFKIHLVESKIFRIEKKSLEKEKRFHQIQQRYEKKSRAFMKQIKGLENRIHELQLEDIHSTVLPSLKKNQNKEKFDPLEAIAQAVEKADIDYFPEHIIEFFEDHVGFKLTNANKHLFKEHIKAFFTTSEDSFIQSFQENRAANF